MSRKLWKARRDRAHESLVRWDQDLKVQPALAESWETPDNKTYVFHLRQGVKFHSGKELDSGDVVYSLNSQKMPPPPGNVTSFYPKIGSVEAVDKYTVKLNMAQPDGTVLGYLAWNIYSHIVPAGLYDRSDPRNTADGTGPENVKVRQAINAAIDRQAIIDNVYAGDAAFTSKIPTSYGDWPIPEADLRSKWEKYDPDTARRLMSEAGVNGFNVTLPAIANPNDYVQIAEIVKAQLSRQRAR